MKSYFNKLATRATLTKLPSAAIAKPQRVAEPRDPFAELPQPDVSRSRPNKPGNKHEQLNADDGSPKPLPRQRRARAQPRVTEADPKPPVVKLSPKVEPAAKIRIAKSDVEDPGPAQRKKEAGRPGEKPETPAAIKITPSESLTSKTLHGTRLRDSKDDRNDAAVTESAAEQQLARLRDEQTLLLRKADQFMSELFNRPKDNRRQDRDENEREDTVRLQPPVETLEPARPATTQAPAVPTTESQTQSLVIGKLTVEVSPPPPVSAPTRQLVVYRQGRSGTGGVPSGRRFGLGQF